jgi:16S rRNA (guanine966-N2)-methyltransferase
MRVIAGAFRHRLLQEADKSTTRPTTDKNREMVFNVLGQFFTAGTALDLYAGTGAMGIEALSRGILRCDFVDRDADAIRTIRTNLETLRVPADRAVVIRADAAEFLATRTGAPYDLVFLDPPYADGVAAAALAAIAARALVAPDGTVVVETDRRHVHEARHGRLALVREIAAGHAKFAFFRWEDSL